MGTPTLSSRVPVPLPEDPYEAIRQAYLVVMDVESEPFKDPIKTETLESPHTVAPPTCHVEESKGSGTSDVRSMSSDSITPLLPNHPLTHTTPILVPSLCRTAHMAVRVLPEMSPSFSVSIAEVASMPDSAFQKRFMSSYDSSPSPTFPVRKGYIDTFRLILDTDSEGDELGDEDDKEEGVEESLDSDSESEDAEDEGPITEDKDPVAGDEDLAMGDEGPGMGVESLGLGGDEVVPKGQQRAAPVVETTIGEPLGLRYMALRHQEIALGEGWKPSVFEPTLATWIDSKDGIVYIDVPAYPPLAPPVQTSPSPEWTSGSLPISPSPFIVPSPISSPMISLIISSPVASPATAEAKGFLAELGAQVEMQGGLIHDHTVRLGELSPALFERYDRDIGELFTRSGLVRDEIFSQRYRFRSLEHEQKRTAMTFRALWRSAALQQELQEMRGRVTALEHERDRREQYGYCKNHKKRAKNGTKRTQERKEYTRDGNYQALCMRTRNSYFPNNSPVTIRRRRNKRRTPNVVEPELHTIVEVTPMADNRTMEELLQAPTEGYGEAIIILEINADHFEIKTNLLQLNVSRMNTTSKKNASKTDDRIDKLADQISTLVNIFAKKVVTPALVKAVEESCVTCGGAHAYYNCPNTDNNQPSVCVATGTYNQVAPQNCASNYMAQPGFATV
uniref:Reverse transcriptase domain-containing protein, chloroplastic n=1 Tax=Tanacetum cinerariifolium TaxID=118510 RepID=A0A6L2KTW5_TANCI|nr:reverse transcriptase domain-containing protein, chloroplastic [Tanacetum cinerariifolium]